MPEQELTLKRALSLGPVTYYGLGTILGAGIYVLVGKVAGQAGLYAPLSFLAAGVIAAFTAFSYAELAARYPHSAGPAVYVREGLGLRWLARLVGALIVLSAVVSCATLVSGFAGYLDVFVSLPHWAVITALLAALTGLAAWGITESVRAASIVTLVEIGGLLLIIATSGASFATLPQRLPELLPPLQRETWEGIFLGAFIAFYAFLGFEDMVHVAEEVEDPQRTLPRAILLALALATLLYLLVAVAAVLTLPPATLAKSSAPLAEMYQRATGDAPLLISLISLFAVTNGALIQIIMGSRVLYGMSRQGWLPPPLGRVSARTRTPLLATAVIALGALALALWLPLVTLAKTTSFLLLLVFALVNLSLLRVKRRIPAVAGVRCYPAWVPLAGLCATLGLIAFQLAVWLAG
jgi:amino acid transporter